MLNIKLNQKKLINKKLKNMRKTRISLLFVLVLALSAIPFSLFVVNVTGSTPLPDYEPIDMGAGLRDKEAKLNLEFPEGVESSGLHTSDTIGNVKLMLYYDDTAPGGYTLFGAYYIRAAIGEYCEVWVMYDRDTGEYDLDYPTLGDDRNPVIVTQAQLDYLANEFDEIIPKDRAYFGDEDFHNGLNAEFDDLIGAPSDYYYDPDGKSMIMISNIGDESYYDDTYPNYIAGFYWSTYEYYFDRNIINIDAYDFVHRVGEPDNPDCESWWIPDDPKNRINLYESIIAHEYQHLIHADWFPGDETFMNEASSLLAEPICGYEFDLSQVEWFLATPDNSLTYWGEQGGKNILADYGAAFLWALYLTDHYGFDFIQRYVQANWLWDPETGWQYIDAPTDAIARINYLLPERVDFNDVFHDWRLANLIHSNIGKSDKYNYVLDDLRAYSGNDNHFIPWDELQPLEIMEVEGKKIPWTSGVDAFGETLSLEDPPDAPLGWPTGYSTLAPYSTDYIRFPDIRGINVFQFNGDDTADIPMTPYEQWTYDEVNTMWWSGMDDLINSLIATQVSVPDNNPILELYTYWDIEDYWDFGFVQVSLDGTWDSWTSLDNLEGDTTMIIDPAAHPDAVANLPGLTGWSGDFVTITFDLSDYAGMDIYLGFRYVTDWLNEIPYYGWYIDDVLLKGDGVDPEDEDIIGDFTTFLPPYPDAEFMVSIVTKFSFRGHEFYSVYDLGLNNEEYGSTYLFGSKWIETTVVVSPINPTGYVDYQFKVSKLKKHGHGHCMF